MMQRDFLKGLSTRRSSGETRSLHADSRGVRERAADGRERWRFAWAEVEEIRTYKRDLITTDLVCLEFQVGELAHVVHEEEPGWDAVVEQMRRQFLAIPTNWAETVIEPAFATNERVLYQRSTEEGAAGPAATPDAPRR